MDNLIQEVINLKVDREINLSMGTSRFDTKWKNKSMVWSEFLARLQTPTVTQESVATYSKMAKSKRDEVKDVGGFVGGFLKQGRRKADHVQSRSIVTLDADSGKPGLWEDIQTQSTFAIAVYTTHSHTTSKPRYRFIIPLDRPVTVDEYEPLARKIADTFGMDYFDDTTYQAERLMYWPSHSIDGEYIFDYKDGAWCDPDAILAEYEDWTDSSYWPESSRGHGVRERAAKKQGDPMSKPGVIGAFNRTYDLHTAIRTFLDEVYAETHDENRYTFLEGSTSGGLVIYDDKFAYSHHGTDPVGDQLVSAFDLVRIHLYGDLDDDVKPKTPINKRPSSIAMGDFAREIPAIRKELAREKVASAKDDFEEFEIADDEDSDEWLAELTVTKTGDIEPTANNLEIIFKFDPNLKGKVFMDEFAHRITVRENLPWRETDGRRFWDDTDDAGLRVYIEKTYGIVARSKIEDALMLDVERNGINPVKDYLDSLVWDGEKRVETLLIDYLGADDSEVNRMFTRKFLTAAVARIYEPGIKFDHMLVTTGAQGLGKTFLPSKLAGEWFSNSLDTVTGKEAYEALQGVWIMEMGELSATKKADIETLKHFITKQEDVYRVAYGRHKSYFKRTAVFWGTSNDNDFLRDKTGNRRFWPVAVGKQPAKHDLFKMPEEVRDQIWAEAKHLYKNGEKIYLEGAEADLANDVQEMHSEGSIMEGEIMAFLEIPITEDWYTLSKYERREYISDYGGEMGLEGEVVRDRISVAEIWNELYRQETSRMHPAKTAEIRNILSNMPGWEKAQTNKGQSRLGPGYGRQVTYFKQNVDSN